MKKSRDFLWKQIGTEYISWYIDFPTYFILKKCFSLTFCSVLSEDFYRNSYVFWYQYIKDLDCCWFSGSAFTRWLHSMWGKCFQRLWKPNTDFLIGMSVKFVWEDIPWVCKSSSTTIYQYIFCFNDSLFFSILLIVFFQRVSCIMSLKKFPV